jgi:hypothetical protein
MIINKKQGVNFKKLKKYSKITDNLMKDNLQTYKLNQFITTAIL